MNNNQQPQQMNVLYTDGFNGGVGPADLHVDLHLRGQPMLRVIMAHSTAKQLQLALADLILQFEKGSDQKVTSLNDVEAKLTGTPRASSIIQ